MSELALFLLGFSIFAVLMSIKIVLQDIHTALTAIVAFTALLCKKDNNG